MRKTLVLVDKSQHCQKSDLTLRFVSCKKQVDINRNCRLFKVNAKLVSLRARSIRGKTLIKSSDGMIMIMISMAYSSRIRMRETKSEYKILVSDIHRKRLGSRLN
jgi:hypothetical protein